MNIEAEKLREAAYWRERFNILRAANAKMSEETYKKVEAAFDLAQRDIQRDIDVWLSRFANNNGIVDMAAARRFLDAGQLKEFKWDVKEYIKRGKENAVSGQWVKQLENASARVHISRLEALKLRTQNFLETAFAAENNAVEGLVRDVYKTGYYRTVYELQKGTRVGFDIAGLDTKRLDAVAHKPWTLDARTFSDRIWQQKDKMVNTLHQEIIRTCIYGRSQNEAAKALEQYVKKGIKNAEYCARRVIITETAYFSSLSQHDGLMELDCEWYEIDLPLDARSCPLCRDMNGRRFKLSEFEVGATAPPFHPNCANGAVIPYFDDDFDVDKDGAREFPDGISYGEWEKKFVGSGLTSDGDRGIIETDNIVDLCAKLPSQKGNKPAFSSEDLKQIETELQRIPEKHRNVIEQTVKSVAIAQTSDGSYNAVSKILKLKPGVIPETFIHECGHILADAYKVYDDPEFIDILCDGLDLNPYSLIPIYYEPKKSYVFLVSSEKFVDPYQGRCYINMDSLDYSENLSPIVFQDYISVGYETYFNNPKLLREKDPKLFDYIERKMIK